MYFAPFFHVYDIIKWAASRLLLLACKVLRARPRESVVKLENRARLLNGYVSRNESVRRTFVAIGKNLCESAEVRKMSEFVIIRAFVIKKKKNGEPVSNFNFIRVIIVKETILLARRDIISRTG